LINWLCANVPHEDKKQQHRSHQPATICRRQKAEYRETCEGNNSVSERRPSARLRCACSADAYLV
jgi:hypothetical protein